MGIILIIVGPEGKVWSRDAITSYLKPGRLADVLALIQVLAYHHGTSRSESGLNDELQRKPLEGETWMALAKEHPEFFRVRNDPDQKLRVALLARYVLDYKELPDGEEKRPLPLGKRNYAIRQAYAFIDDKLPKGSIIQQNPDTFIDYGRYKLYFELYNGLYGRRQVILADKNQTAGFGGNKRDVEAATSAISTLFSAEISDVHQVVNICSKYHISALIVKDTDSLWANKNSLIWRLTPDFDNSYVKVFIFRPL